MTGTNRSAREWVTAVARPNTPLFLSFLISGQDREAIEAHTGLPFGFENIRRTGIRLQYDRTELAGAAAVIHERSIEDGVAFFDRYADRCLDSCRSLLTTVDQLAGEHKQAGDQGGIGLGPALSRYFAAAAGLATFLQTLIVVQFELENLLRQSVADRMDRPSDEDVRRVMAALQLAIEPTDELRNLTEMLELAALVQRTAEDYRDWIDADPIAVLTHIAHRHQAIWKGVEGYQERFGWMGRRYYSGDPITEIDVLVRLQNLLREDCEARLADVDQRRRDHVAEREQAVELLGGDDARPLADVLSRFMYLRSYRLDVFFIAHERVVPLLEDAARRLALGGYDDTVYLAWQELADGLQGRSDGIELAARAAERRSGFEFASRAGSTEWIPNRDERAAAPGLNASTNLIEGVSSWPGQFQGRVRVVSDDDDMRRMEQGEVLVATMTQPRLMLAVEKAGAIVTDEGGMLCHAAIVSRECDLPCVIGTERATHVLRTGDLVDVDATAGCVRLISRPQQHLTNKELEP